MDLNLHSFFSGHRPLLLLSQPSSSLFESWQDLQFSNNPDPAASHHQSLLKQLGGINLEDPPEATPEADADAARMLNRALVVNRLGGTVSWEETLAKLGIVEERTSSAEMGMGARDVVNMGVSMMNAFDAYMDSTKRKRRSKMKKHKLKKRRRVRSFFPLSPYPDGLYNMHLLPLLAATIAEDQDWQIDLNHHARFSRYSFLNSQSSTTTWHRHLARREYT